MKKMEKWRVRFYNMETGEVVEFCIRAETKAKAIGRCWRWLRKHEFEFHKIEVYDWEDNEGLKGSY